MSNAQLFENPSRRENHTLPTMALVFKVVVATLTLSSN